MGSKVYEVAEWIHVAQIMIQLRALQNTVLALRVYRNF